MIRSDAAVRPTRRRLLVANIIATGLVTALLGLADLLPSRQVIPPDGGDTVRLQVSLVEPLVTPPPEALPQPPSHRSVPRQARPADVAPEASPTVRTDSAQAPDVSTIAADAVRTVVSDFYRDESSRADRWRQSGSVMFRPTDELVADLHAPVLADFRFRPEVHVAGLGVTIGSCFIGVPLVGVPVEDRTVAITLIVCARESG